MSSRIIEMREQLYNKLQELKTPAPAGRSDWGHIKSQIVSSSPSCAALTPSYNYPNIGNVLLYWIEQGAMRLTRQRLFDLLDW